MPHDNIVFHAVLKLVPWDELDRAAERHGAGRARNFRLKSRLVARLYGQLAGASSLRETRPLPPGSTVLSDRIGTLPARQAANRRNPYHKPVRELQVRIDTGAVIHLLSNDLTASAQQIADLYKRRWAIELFFRWVKQTLKITRFLGAAENAVRTQVAVALIAFLLLRLAQQAQTAITSVRMARCMLA